MAHPRDDAQNTYQRTSGPPQLLQPRYAMSFLRGPMTRVELQAALRARR